MGLRRQLPGHAIRETHVVHVRDVPGRREVLLDGHGRAHLNQRVQRPFNGSAGLPEGKVGADDAARALRLLRPDDMLWKTPRRAGQARTRVLAEFGLALRRLGLEAGRQGRRALRRSSEALEEPRRDGFTGPAPLRQLLLYLLKDDPAGLARVGLWV